MPERSILQSNPLPMSVALIGYGEVGRILAEDLRAQGVAVCAFDKKLDNPGDLTGQGASAAGASATVVAAGVLSTAAPLSSADDAAPLRAHAAAHGVRLATSAAQAVQGAALVISAVTASQAVPVAQACAGSLGAGSFFLDFNSASPGAKISAAALVHAGAGRYVEGAVMTSIPPYRIKVPLLLGGPHAVSLLPLLEVLGFKARVASEQLGVASATKMCRSVMIKGLEAMVIESFTAARAYGVEDQVIASLAETFPGIDWEKQGAYFFQRVIEHGRRRSEEVREVAQTVSDMGLTPWSASGTAQRQAWVADAADEGWFGSKGQPGFARSADWRVEADRILAHVKPTGADAAPAAQTPMPQAGRRKVDTPLSSDLQAPARRVP